ncbi:hypothetical protein Baya_2162 [Bagarius yarrelli]|uniref:Uncharacterized protein n=1 Tax=Bagarius yarrelli TaxID=175774 RepID=A0A556TN93_BAGYA|nr:hypothetical protein Baya_2162 [Bagarius yarrelli]
MELMQEILSRTSLKDDDTRMCSLGVKALTAVPPQANTDDLELENFEGDLNARQTSHSPKSCADYSDVKTVASVSSEKGFNVKLMQPELIDKLKEKLQKKDAENQQIVRLLLVKQHELIEISKLREVEAQLMTERLKYEEQRNLEMIKKCNHALKNMRDQLSMAKSKNEHFTKQLRAIMEKYERLKRRTDCIKKQLAQERKERKSSQKALKESRQISEEFLLNQDFLEKQRHAAKQENVGLRKNLQTMEEQHNELVRTIQKLEDESLSMKADYGKLKDQLLNTERERQQLNQALQSKELEKKEADKSLRQSEKLVKQLQDELGDSKKERETAEEQLDTIKKDVKLIHDRYKVKTLQLQKQHQSCIEQLEAKNSECEALSEVVSKLKEDKLLIQDELQSLQKEKAKSEMENKKQEERMREVVSLLEHEKKLLLDEMGDLRKDYFSLSDRIAQRFEQLEKPDVPMCITDISSNLHQITKAKTNNLVGQITSHMDLIEHIRKKLEDEEEENTHPK